MTTSLHYIYDPLCGWCYGVAPLVKAAREIFRVIPHGGGMMTGTQRQTITPQLRAYVRQHDERIAQLTGQHFGSGYVDRLLNDTGAILDSEPPTTAMLAAEEIAGHGLDMLARLQIAHYVEGRRISEPAVLIEIAAEQGLHPAHFAEAMDRLAHEALQVHFRETRSLMAKVRAQGFPTLVLQTSDGLQVVDFAADLARPRDFQDRLRRMSRSREDISTNMAPFCDTKGCTG